LYTSSLIFFILDLKVTYLFQSSGQFPIFVDFNCLIETNYLACVAVVLLTTPIQLDTKRFRLSQALSRTWALWTGDSSAELLQATDRKAEWVLQMLQPTLHSGEYSPFVLSLSGKASFIYILRPVCNIYFTLVQKN